MSLCVLTNDAGRRFRLFDKKRVEWVSKSVESSHGTENNFLLFPPLSEKDGREATVCEAMKCLFNLVEINSVENIETNCV